MLEEIITEMQREASPLQAEGQQRFFKTGPGQYAEGDLFMGLTVPQIRKICKKYADISSLNDIEQMLRHKFHDLRLLGLLMMIHKFNRGGPEARCQIYKLYIDNIPGINNWDLVDISAAPIVGAYVYPNPEVLWTLADRNHLWSQRIAMIASHYFIKQGDYEPTLKLAENFIASQHDLMHKASGWMLREVGKKDLGRLCAFLDRHSAAMPRTMLRYAVEKLDPGQRQKYLSQKTLNL